MTKKQLQEFYWMKRNIQKLEDKLLELETEATRQTTRLSNEPKGSHLSSDKITSIVIKIVEVQEEINNKLKQAYALVAKIEVAIAILPEREQYLVRSRYLECKSWEQIAVDMNYSWQWVHKIHSKALKLLDDKRGEEKRYIDMI